MRKGFTLIELMVVVVIISILAATVMIHIGEQPDVVKKKRVPVDLVSIRTGLMMYSLDAGVYPTTEQGLKALIEKPTSPPVPSVWSRHLENDPIDPWGNEYKYRYPGEHNKDGSDIWSMGPDGKDGTEDDIGNWKKQ